MYHHWLNLIQLGAYLQECVNYNRNTIYDLIASHGDVEDMVFFAVLMQGEACFQTQMFRNTECQFCPEPWHITTDLQSTASFQLRN